MVLYELLTIRRPFEGSDVHLILQAVISQTPARPRTIDRTIPIDLQTICEKMMEKEPARRYQTAAHAAADLRCFLSNRPILARPPTLIRRLGVWGRAHRIETISAAAVLLLLTTGLMTWRMISMRSQSLAWLEVSSDVRMCRVSIRHVDPATNELDPGARELGVTPLGPIGMEPGQYRVVVAAPGNDAFAEFDTFLLPSRDALTSLRVVRGGFPPPVNAPGADSAHLGVPDPDAAGGGPGDDPGRCRRVRVRSGSLRGGEPAAHGAPGRVLHR